MTTYNAKDLIQQATMLADLQNSDFISWKENMMFLDNVWTELYQQIINHGDKTFLKSFTFSGDRVDLPCDFYQLYYICYTNGPFKSPINRRAKTATTSGPYYDIIDDELIIYNMPYGGLHGITVEYFPVKESITYASDDHRCEPVSGTILDVCDKYILYMANNSNYYTKDILNNSESTLTSKSFMIAKQGLFSDSPDKAYFKSNNNAFYSTFADDTLTFYKANGKELLSISDVKDPDFPKGQINALVSDGVYYVRKADHKLYFYSFDGKAEHEEASDLVDTRVYAFDDDIYYQTKEGLWCNDELILKARDFDEVNGVMKADENTGYGILVDNYLIKSIYNNTEFLYPNNFYYNYMAYKLAIYYKVKQGADATALASLADDALKTFYNTLPRDENEFVRITNAYAR